MAARLRHQGIGKTLELGFAGDVSLGGIIDQLLPNSVPDASKRKAARQAKQQYPVLQRGMRTSEVWGDCVGDLQAGVMALSLVSPLTMHGQRAHRASPATSGLWRSGPTRCRWRPSWTRMWTSWPSPTATA